MKHFLQGGRCSNQDLTIWTGNPLTSLLICSDNSRESWGTVAGRAAARQEAPVAAGPRAPRLQGASGAPAGAGWGWPRSGVGLGAGWGKLWFKHHLHKK